MSSSPEALGTELQIAAGAIVEIYWDGDDAWYLGKVAGQQAADGKWRVEYDDGEVERLDFRYERFRIVRKK